MIYPVRILDAGGNLRQVVSSRQLSNLHWKKFDQTVTREFSIGQKKGEDKTNSRFPDSDDETLDPDPI
ncbi:MAG: hypothetical protein G3M70_05025 [Candidatus Nitronauta litoralis]|uniref:Uncharacterized protein n=1 Tax=Candidatus Nitronauta litoralis TaxID=2705533 RepID=A0A7T0BUI8_9BACT|nr:MAG: hypothetical protein G3M70_05025 [Candidatus Nitronauta litoralis]